MHKLKIQRLGPVTECKLKCSHFMILTGMQASGKSTVAKAIYYFRTVKDDIYAAIERRAVEAFQNSSSQSDGLTRELLDILRKKFFQLFGSSWGMDQGMKLEYHYTKDCYIKLYLKEALDYPTPNYLWIELCRTLRDFLEKGDHSLYATATGIPTPQRERLQSELQNIFDDKYNIVYIPAGRSMLTLLAQQWSYIYIMMDEAQKRTLDYCTQKYIERILAVKPEFSDGLGGLLASYGTHETLGTWKTALALVDEILRGSYKVEDGVERIVLENGKYVKINFASSGQQESVWILNLLLYYFAQNRPSMFFIEEPESHLFPRTQKSIMELIALISNEGHSMLVTTHSPYVLGTLNNLLYAGYFRRSDRQKQAADLFPNSLWLDHEEFDAWFVSDGKLENCMDSEIHLIQNEKIDEVSTVINDDYDRLFELRHKEDGTNASR